MHRHSLHSDPADRAFDTLLARTLDAYAQKQEAFQRTLAPFDSWCLGDGSDSLSFTADSHPPLVLRITPIGTYMPSVGEWAWAWANDGFSETSRNEASRIRALAGKTQYKIFDTPFFDATLPDIDELCALALHELEGAAIFKIKDQEPWCFYVVYA